jgi:peptidoglycan/LPS O-acetylase OafA/YrhL
MNQVKDARRRHWADVVAIVAGVWSFGEALWGPALFSSETIDRGAGATWLAFGIGGLLAIVAVLLAQRYTRPARIALGLAGLILLASPFAYRHPVLLPIVTSVAAGLAMLAAAPFIGRMPRDLPP